jgi:hypothetical protein
MMEADGPLPPEHVKAATPSGASLKGHSPQVLICGLHWKRMVQDPYSAGYRQMPDILDGRPWGKHHGFFRAVTDHPEEQN